MSNLPDRDSRAYVAGHSGLVGRAIVRRLEGRKSLLLRTHAELDLTDARAVNRFFAEQRPTEVYVAAGMVGGIRDNVQRPANFIRENLLIAANVIDAAYHHGVRKLLYLGSSCVYPKHAPQPIRPEALLSGPLESTNRAYAIAKIAGLELCRAYRQQYGFNAIAAMPTNLYGPFDRFDAERSHVIPALLMRCAEALSGGARRLTVWGSGQPRREFLYADDLAEALECLMDHYEGQDVVNVGYGEDLTIAELARLIAKTVGFAGEIRFDTAEPDGTPQKLLDVSVIRSLGWRPRTTLDEGLAKTWAWLRSQS